MAACDETSTSKRPWSPIGGLAPVLDERARRLWAGAEAQAIGYGGDALVSAATGLTRETIRNGRRELAEGVAVTGRVRRAGAGRPVVDTTQPGLTAALEQLIEPLTRGDPVAASCRLRPTNWTSRPGTCAFASLRSRTGPTFCPGAAMESRDTSAWASGLAPVRRPCAPGSRRSAPSSRTTGLGG